MEVPFFHNLRLLLQRTLSGWLYHDAPRIGAALAFYTLLSFAPLLMISIAVGSALFDGSRVEARVLEEVSILTGPEGATLAAQMIEKTRASSLGVIASMAGFFTLLFGASGILAELRSALNTMWEIPPQKSNGFLQIIKDRVLSVGMVLAVGFLLVVSLIVSAILAALGKYLQDTLPAPTALLEFLNFIISFAGSTILFGLVLRFIPDARLPWRPILYGAATTALLFTVGKSIIGLYLGRAALGSPYGAGGSIVVLVAWVYYSAQIFLFGAEFTQQVTLKTDSILEERRKRKE